MLVFLDSHIEVNVGWLEPLVERVSMTQNTVVLPIIDIIDSDTLRYKSSPLVRGGFTWSMRFSWEPIPSSVLEEQPLYVRYIGVVLCRHMFTYYDCVLFILLITYVCVCHAIGEFIHNSRFVQHSFVLE